MPPDHKIDKNRRKRLIQAVHCTEKYKNVYQHDRGLYEYVLKNRYKKKSSTELTTRQLYDFLDFLNDRETHTRATGKQIWKIRKLWQEKSIVKTEKSLLKFIERQTKKRYLRLVDIQFLEAQDLIITLMNWQVSPAMKRGGDNACLRYRNRKRNTGRRRKS